MNVDKNEPSTKDYVRVWYTSYKLALQNDGLKDVVAESTHLYEKWGDIRRGRFETWWRAHKAQFIVHETTAREAAGVLTLAVPIAQPIDATFSQIRNLIRAKRPAHIDTELASDILEFYQRVYVPRCKEAEVRVGVDLLKACAAFYKGRKGRLAFLGKSDTASTLRSLGRYVIKAHMLVASAATGYFPLEPPNFRELEIKIQRGLTSIYYDKLGD